MKKIRMGVIGLGMISDAHLVGILHSDDAELLAICDSSERNLHAKGDELGIPASLRFTHYEDLLRHPDIDAVSICTPNVSHFPIADEAIRCGKPFALEKPVSLDVREATMLRERAKARGVTNIVCFSYRYKSAVRYAKWLIDHGKLGQINHIYSQYLQSWSIPEDLPLVWRFQKSLSGSGSLGDLGSHILDLTRFLIGDVVEVAAHAGTIVRTRRLIDEAGTGEVDVDDFCNVLAMLEGGVSSTMAISRFAYGKGNYQQLQIYGTKGALIYELDDEDVLYLNLEGHEGDFRKASIPESFRANQMQSFFDILNEKGDGLSATLEDGYINQQTIEAIIESYTRKQWVSLHNEEE